MNDHLSHLHDRRRLAPCVLILSTALLLSLLALACGDPSLKNDDPSRGLAKQLPLGQVVTDTISPPEDPSDWKVIEVPGPGFLTVTVFWDNANIDSTVAMVDNFGKVIQRVRRDSRTPRDQMIIKCDQASFFYLAIDSTRDASVYSVQSSFSQQGEGGPGGTDDEPIPEFVSPIDVGTEGDEVK